MELQFLPLVVLMPERSSLTVDLQADGVRVLVGNAVLQLLDGRPVASEADQEGAFERCRPQALALVGRLLAEGRGLAGGLALTPEDVT
jgi:hypothetical protein